MKGLALIFSVVLVASVLVSPVIAAEAASALTATAETKGRTWKEIVDDCVAKTKALMEADRKEEALEYIEAQRAKYAATPEYKDDPDLLPRLAWIEADVAQDVGTFYADKKDWPRAEDYYEKAVNLYFSLRKTAVGRYKNFQKTMGDCDEPDKGGAVQNLFWSARMNAKQDPEHADEYLKRYTNICNNVRITGPGKGK